MVTSCVSQTSSGGTAARKGEVVTDGEDEDGNQDDVGDDTGTGVDQDVNLSAAEEQGSLFGDDESPDHSGNEGQYGTDQ